MGYSRVQAALDRIGDRDQPAFELDGAQHALQRFVQYLVQFQRAADRRRYLVDDIELFVALLCFVQQPQPFNGHGGLPGQGGQAADFLFGKASGLPVNGNNVPDPAPGNVQRGTQQAASAHLLYE